LSQGGIDPWIHDHQMKTPLLYASEHGNFEVVKVLVDFYGDGICEHVEEINRAICGAMTRRSRFSRHHIVPSDGDDDTDWVISEGEESDPARPGDSHRDTESRILILLCLLAVPGVNVNPVMKRRSLFLFAAQVGSFELIERLLEFTETKVNEYNRRGTGLMIALEKGFKEISIKLIEDDRIDVNYVNMRGKSLVESAIEGGHFEVLSHLISSPRFDAGFHNVHSALKLSIKGK
jgi:ankyrin repeat protein